MGGRAVLLPRPPLSPLVSVGALAPEFLIDQTSAIVHHTCRIRIHAALALLSVPSQGMQRVITDQGAAAWLMVGSIGHECAIASCVKQLPFVESDDAKDDGRAGGGSSERSGLIREALDLVQVPSTCFKHP